MPLTVPPAVSPLRLDGKPARHYLYTGTIASATHVPTRAEMGAATTYDITEYMAPGGLVGFGVGVEKTQVPNFGGISLPQTVSGPKTVDANTQIVTKASKDGVDIRDFVDEGDVVYYAALPDGDTPDSFQQVYKLQVASITPTKDTGDFQRVILDVNLLGSNERALIPALS